MEVAIMKKQIHVKEYTRKRHGRAKFGGKVSSHNKSGKEHYSGRYIRGVPSNPQLLNQLSAMIGDKVKIKGDFPITYTLKDVGVTEGGSVEAIIEDQYGTDVVDGKLIIKVKSGRATDDEIIFKQYKDAYNSVPGPRVGDYLEHDGKKTRITYIWRDEHNIPLQYQDGGHAESYGFHLGNGFMSYSGGLDSGVSTDDYSLRDTGRRENGAVWFFKGGRAGAGRGVDKTMKFRVFEAVKKSGK